MKKSFWKRVSLWITATLALLVLVACNLTPNSVDGAKKRMEKQGYIVTVIDLDEPSQYAMYKEQDAEKVLVCVEDDDDENVIVAIFFDEESEAERFYKNNHLKGDHEVYRQDGHWVFFGTKEAEYDFTY